MGMVWHCGTSKNCADDLEQYSPEASGKDFPELSKVSAGLHEQR